VSKSNHDWLAKCLRSSESSTVSGQRQLDRRDLSTICVTSHEYAHAMWAQFHSLVSRFGDVSDVWSKVSHVNCCSLETGVLELLRVTISVHLHGTCCWVLKMRFWALLARLPAAQPQPSCATRINILIAVLALSLGAATQKPRCVYCM
jgi:hypothetical protein